MVNYSMMLKGIFNFVLKPQTVRQQFIKLMMFGTRWIMFSKVYIYIDFLCERRDKFKRYLTIHKLCNTELVGNVLMHGSRTK